MEELRDVTCDDPWAVEEGNKMFDWINETLNDWDSDKDLIWKASVQHHPMFAKWYDDFPHIV